MVGTDFSEGSSLQSVLQIKTRVRTLVTFMHPWIRHLPGAALEKPLHILSICNAVNLIQKPRLHKASEALTRHPEWGEGVWRDRFLTDSERTMTHMCQPPCKRLTPLAHACFWATEGTWLEQRSHTWGSRGKHTFKPRWQGPTSRPLVQWIWGGTQERAFLTSFQDVLRLLVQELYSSEACITSMTLEMQGPIWGLDLAKIPVQCKVLLDYHLGVHQVMWTCETELTHVPSPPVCLKMLLWAGVQQIHVQGLSKIYEQGLSRCIQLTMRNKYIHKEVDGEATVKSMLRVPSTELTVYSSVFPPLSGNEKGLPTTAAIWRLSYLTCSLSLPPPGQSRGSWWRTPAPQASGPSCRMSLWLQSL